MSHGAPWRRMESQIRDEVLAGQKMSWHAYRAVPPQPPTTAATTDNRRRAKSIKLVTRLRELSSSSSSCPLVRPAVPASKPPYFLPTLRVYGNELCPPRTSAECKICNTTALPPLLSLFLSGRPRHSPSPFRACTEASRRAAISCV